MAQLAYLPINPARGFPQQFQCRIRRIMFEFVVRYNAEGDFYTIDVLDQDGDPIVYGRPVIYGADVLDGIIDDRLPAVSLIAADLAGRRHEVGRGSLGEDVQLWVVDR